MVRIRRKLDSEMLYLPELKQHIGKMVDIIVKEEFGAELSDAKATPGVGNSGCFHDAAPPKLPDDKEIIALRKLLTTEQFDALMDVASRGGPDLDAIGRVRVKSMT